MIIFLIYKGLNSKIKRIQETTIQIRPTAQPVQSKAAANLSFSLNLYFAAALLCPGFPAPCPTHPPTTHRLPLMSASRFAVALTPPQPQPTAHNIPPCCGALGTGQPLHFRQPQPPPVSHRTRQHHSRN